MSTLESQDVPGGSIEGTTFRTKKQAVVDWLREQIISGEFRPGTRITQADVAERLRVSITPVREALNQLVAEGYLERVTHVGVTVIEASRDRVEEVFPLRLMLEGFLAAHAAENATADDLAVLHQLSWSLERAIRDGDVTAQRALNFRFHQRVWHSARQPVALDLANRLWAKFPADLLFHVPTRGERTVAEHAALVNAIVSHDPLAAEQAMAAHIASGLRDQRDFRSRTVQS